MNSLFQAVHLEVIRVDVGFLKVELELLLDVFIRVFGLDDEEQRVVSILEVGTFDTLHTKRLKKLSSISLHWVEHAVQLANGTFKVGKESITTLHTSVIVDDNLSIWISTAA